MRAFLAVSVVEPALTPLLELQNACRRDAPGVRWARTESLHLTLRFFADLDGGSVTALMREVAAGVASTPKFQLQLRDLGSFPAQRPRVLWLGVGEGKAALTNLFHAVDTAVDAAGFARDARPFSPHCTLGRPRQPWNGEANWNAPAAGIVTELPRFGVEAVDLYESRDGYRVIASAPIGVSATDSCRQPG